MWEPTELAYAAGLFDGEGCITARRNNGSDYYQVAVSLSQRDPTVLLWLEEHIGGKAKVATRSEWTLHGHDAIYPFLAAVEPFMIVKADQAVTALRLMELSRPVRGTEADRLAARLSTLKREQYT